LNGVKIMSNHNSWNDLLEIYKPFMNKTVKDKMGKKYFFEGLVCAADGYYYLLTSIDEGVSTLETCSTFLFDEYTLI